MGLLDRFKKKETHRILFIHVNENLLNMSIGGNYSLTGAIAKERGETYNSGVLDEIKQDYSSMLNVTNRTLNNLQQGNEENANSADLIRDALSPLLFNMLFYVFPDEWQIKKGHATRMNDNVSSLIDEYINKHFTECKSSKIIAKEQCCNGKYTLYLVSVFC